LSAEVLTQAERSVSVSVPPMAEQSVGILFKMSSDFFKQTPPKQTKEEYPVKNFLTGRRTSKLHGS